LRNAIVLVVVIVVVFLMLVAGRRMRHRTSGPTLARDVKGAEAPDFTLKTIDGKDVKLSALRGKAVLLNFWATWCGPCKIEIPWFIELQKQYASQGLVVIGVAMDDNAKDVVPKFAQDMKIDYPILLGTEQVADQYGGVEGLPMTFYIGRDGKIVKKIPGLTSHSDIEESIKAALNAGGGQQVPPAMLIPQVAQ
jgi:thiol-disulfide isomerase/thioredoxin